MDFRRFVLCGTVAAAGGALSGCLGSSSSSSSGSDNGSGSLADFPSVEIAEGLQFEGEAYDGETDWAFIASSTGENATFTTSGVNSGNAARDAQAAVDTAYMLWHAGHIPHSIMHGTVFWIVEYAELARQVPDQDFEEVFAEFEDELEDVPWDQGFGLGERCQSGSGGDFTFDLDGESGESGSGTFTDVCIEGYTTSDGNPITISGDFTWSNASGMFSEGIGSIDPDGVAVLTPPNQTVTFENVEVNWNGHDFTLSGTNRADDDVNARAIHLTHDDSEQTFKLLSELAGRDDQPRHSYMAYHPDMGKFWALPDQESFDWVNGGFSFLGGGSGNGLSCADGQAEFGELTIYEEGSHDTGQNADFVVELGVDDCDQYALKGDPAPEASDGNLSTSSFDLDIEAVLSGDLEYAD